MSKITQYLSFSVWLILRNITTPRPMYAVVNGRISFYLMTEYYFIVCTCVTFYVFIHLSIDTCFHALWILLEWTWEYRSFFEIVISFPLDSCPEMKLLDYMVCLSFIFWGTSIPFSIAAAPIYIPTNRAWGFPLSHTLLSICYLSFDNSHSNSCGWYLIVVLICISLMTDLNWWLVMLNIYLHIY